MVSTSTGALSFGVSGIPASTPSPNYINGLKQINSLGLDAFELAFVQFVSMSEATAALFLEEKQKIHDENNRHIVITVHAPYFVNLNAAEERKVEESIGRVIKAAHRGSLAGAKSVVFHPGFYLKDSPEEAYTHVAHAMEDLMRQYYQSHGKEDVAMLRPETTGKPNQFGSLDELIRLSNDFPEILPCVDFAHLHARSNGKYNTADEFERILDQLEKGLGERGIKNMHIHYSGIEYSEKGERRHLPLVQSDAAYKDLLKVLKKRKVEGVVICESPNQEEDARLLQQTYLES